MSIWANMGKAPANANLNPHSSLENDALASHASDNAPFYPNSSFMYPHQENFNPQGNIEIGNPHHPDYAKQHSFDMYPNDSGHPHNYLQYAYTNENVYSHTHPSYEENHPQFNHFSEPQPPYGYNHGSYDYSHSAQPQNNMYKRDDSLNIPSSTLWIGGLNTGISEADLKETIRTHGKPEKITYLTDRGMAFVHFESIEECTSVLNSMRGTMINGTFLRLNYGKPVERSWDEAVGRTSERKDRQPRENPATNVLWIGGIAAEHTEEVFREIFGHLEGLMDVNIHREKNCAFLQFRDVAQTILAKEFLASQHKNSINHHSVKVNFGKHMQTSVPVRKTAPLIPKRADDQGYYSTPTVQSSSALPAPTLLPALTLSTNTFDALVPKAQQSSGNDMNSNTFAYYNHCDDRGALLRSEVDRLVFLVDDVHRDSGREQLSEFLRNRQGNAAQAARIIHIRLKHYYVQDPHKKLIVLYAFIEFLLHVASPSVVSAAIGMDLESLISVVAENQCEKGLLYISAIVKIITHLCESHIQDALSRFIVLKPTHDAVESQPDPSFQNQ